MNKPNQDSFAVVPNFDGDESSIFFGVFDGHGSTGDQCSIFAKSNIPKDIVTELREGKDFQEAYVEAFLSTNKALHRAYIDDKMSGTTAITAVIKNNTVHIANCGDSRAIIATQEGEQLVSRPLSVDQTPFRLDERERCKKFGARIMTMDQLEGLAPLHENWGLNLGEEVDEDGDPPRIWSPNGNFPGTAFTRSIGDARAEELGVYAEPETLTFDITPEDKFIILASDGVFEFLTSQSVVDMVNQFDNPLSACQNVVAEAYRLWLQYEIRTDDITMICIFLDSRDVDSRKTGSLKRITLKQADQIRPVRRYMSKAKKRLQMTKDMSLVVTDEDLAYNVAEHIVPKTSEDLAKIKSVVKANFLFQHLSPHERHDIFNVMTRRQVKAGDIVIQQGDKGDQFYCVESGNYEVVVRSTTEDGTKDDVVHKYFGTTHPSFGELALMHGNPRSSSVLATTDGVLWCIDCCAFRKIVMKNPSQDIMRTLRQVEVLSPLNMSQIQRLADALTEIIVQNGQEIFKQGDVGNVFYIIKSGSVICTDPKTNQVEHLQANTYFGEQALLSDEPRTITATADGKTCLLQIGRTVFEKTLGPLQMILEKDTEEREAQNVFDQQVRAAIKKNQNRLDSCSSLSSNALTFVGTVVQTSEGYISLYKTPQGDLYGVKVISIATVEETNNQKAIIQDHTVLQAMTQLNLITPSIPKYTLSWKDQDAIYCGTDRVIVCDLNALGEDIDMSEDIVQQYAAQCVLAIEKLHAKGYVYRNLNPEQLLVDEDGYIQLMDFRYCKGVNKTQTSTLCGTPEYMAPEMISGQGHDTSVDLWALGILIFELLFGETPFVSKKEEETEEEKELNTYAKISRFNSGDLIFPKTISTDAQDLLKQLIEPSIAKRLGVHGAVSVEHGGSILRAHPWFSSINWIDLASKSVKGPQYDLVQEKLKAILEHPEGDGPPPLKKRTSGDVDDKWLIMF